MASTTNYNWNTPDNSGLVKNGAQDMRTLGDAIDASVWNIGFGQAGKNAIINGNFGIWQRGTTFTSPASGSYNADRWLLGYDGNGTATVSRQAFTPGTAPVAGYEGQFFYRVACTAVGTTTTFQTQQRIEDVRTFAGQTITISFWARKDNNRTLGIFTEQNFGSGGSGSVFQTSARITPSTSWARYSATYTLASVAGKTIGANSFLAIYIAMDDTLTTSSQLDIWGVQVEYGSKATPFDTATGSIQAELALCQRYYVRFTSPSAFTALSNYVGANATNQIFFPFCVPVSMRRDVQTVDWGGNLGISDGVSSFTNISSISPSGGVGTYQTLNFNLTTSPMTQFRPYRFTDNGAGTAFIGIGCEL